MKITRQNPIEGYLSRYGDGDLSAEEKAFVDRYVEQHPEAAATLKSVQRTSDQLKEYFETMPPVPLSRLEAFAASLQNQLSHPSAPAGWSRSIPGFRDLFPVRSWSPASVSLLAVLLLTFTFFVVAPDSILRLAQPTPSSQITEGLPIVGDLFAGTSLGVSEERGIRRKQMQVEESVAEPQPSLGFGLTAGNMGMGGMGMGMGMGGGGDGQAQREYAFGGFGSVAGGSLSMGKGVEPVEKYDAGAQLGRPLAMVDDDGDGVAESPASLPTVLDNRKVIRTVQMQLETDNVEATQTEVTALVEQRQGAIAHASFHHQEDQPWVQLTLWIPSERLDDLLEELKAKGKVEQLEIQSQDISELYFDRETRITNLQRQEERLLKLYERDVEKMEELLKVEQELARVRTEIERLQGQQRMADRQIQYSTLHLTLRQKAPVKPIVKSESEDVFTPLRRVGKSASAVLLFSLSLITSLISVVLSLILFFIPWLLIVTAITAIVWVWRKWRLRKSARQ